MPLHYRSFATIVMLLVPPLLHAAPLSQTDARIAQILAQREQVRRIEKVALSWDGQQLAWIVSQHDKARLELASASGRNARTVALPGDCEPKDVRWAPR